MEDGGEMEGLAAMHQVLLQLGGSTSIIINNGAIAFGLQQGSLLRQGDPGHSFLALHGVSGVHPAVITGSSQAARASAERAGGSHACIGSCILAQGDGSLTGLYK
jgi:hypothetical protein